MRQSTSSSGVSRPLHIELRPSRLLAGTLAALGLLAAAGLALTAMPAAAVWPLGVLAAGWATWRAATLGRAPTRLLVFRVDGRLEVDGRPVDAPELAWQGPLAVLRWREHGRARRVVGWPDVIDAATRRELRLWALECAPAAEAPAVAP